MTKWITYGVILVALVAGIFFGIQLKISNQDKEENLLKQEVDEELNELTLEEKIAQLFIISYRQDTVDETLRDLLNLKPGGFILFAENITDYERTTALIEEIESSADIPLWIAVDQEGGRVQRLKATNEMNATNIPSMLQLGKTKDTKLAYDVGTVIAEELRVFGVNMDFAPVLGVIGDENNRVIGDRSFGTDVDVVTNMGLAVAKGLEDHDVIAVYKHFPGHGSTVVDSHYDLPVITKTKEELLASDLIPFQKAINAGAQVMMIGHLAVPSITNNETPASLSKEMITNLLKEEMGYQGLVVTDALNMGALTNHYSEKEIYEKAINAGVDMLLMPTDLGSAISYIKESISEGTITEEQIDESVRKILSLKHRKLSQIKLDKELLGSDLHQEIIKRISL